MADALLQVEDLHTVFGAGREAVQAVRGVSFGVERGETLGIVGESGSGKSVTALSVLRLLMPPGRVASGRVRLDGSDLLPLSERQMRAVRGARIAMVFQDPMTALNPTLTVGEQIAETIQAHQKVTKAEAWAQALDWLKRVRVTLPERRLRQYPHELSGGMRQRVMLAIAFSCRPEVLLADEPTTALDVTVQAQILDLMDELKAELGTAIVLITHDLGVVAQRCKDVAVMYAGQIVEYAPAGDLFAAPKHPYTQALLASLPDWRRPRSNEPLPALPGQPPSLVHIPPGCPFAPRCPRAFALCPVRVPADTHLEEDRTVRCLLYEPDVEKPAGLISDEDGHTEDGGIVP
ncbi:MAG: ABC transporter ATP-binding protein [Armatimonadetes bacterium]|nr:ABC transporter ATP-binding protein [Armatimonadota bacterium]